MYNVCLICSSNIISNMYLNCKHLFDIFMIFHHCSMDCRNISIEFFLYYSDYKLYPFRYSVLSHIGVIQPHGIPAASVGEEGITRHKCHILLKALRKQLPCVYPFI